MNKPNLVLTLAASSALSLTGCQTNSHDLGPSNTVVGATGSQTLAGGVPVGSWNCRFVNNNQAMTFTISGGLLISGDGRGQLMAMYDGAYKPGYSFGVGKFTGLKRVTWQTATSYTKVTRVGNELYCYREAGSRPRLVTGNPPGYSLQDYQSLGGGLTGAAYEAIWGKGPKAGFDLYSIKGRDLVLENSTDGRRWLFKAGSVR